MANNSTLHININPDIDAVLATVDLLSNHNTKVMKENRTRTTIIPGIKPVAPMIKEPSTIPRYLIPKKVKVRSISIKIKHITKILDII